MKTPFLIISLLTALFVLSPPLLAADAPTPERSITERLDDLEAYINNSARNATTNSSSKIKGDFSKCPTRLQFVAAGIAPHRFQ